MLPSSECAHKVIAFSGAPLLSVTEEGGVVV